MDGDPCEKSKIGNCETDSPEANGDDEEVEGQFWRDYIDQGQKDGDHNKHFHFPFFGFLGVKALPAATMWSATILRITFAMVFPRWSASAFTYSLSLGGRFG